MASREALALQLTSATSRAATRGASTKRCLRPVRPRVHGVSISPGSSEMHRMPVPANSCSQMRVKCWSAALLHRRHRPPRVLVLPAAITETFSTTAPPLSRAAGRPKNPIGSWSSRNVPPGHLSMRARSKSSHSGRPTIARASDPGSDALLMSTSQPAEGAQIATLYGVCPLCWKHPRSQNREGRPNSCVTRTTHRGLRATKATSAPRPSSSRTRASPRPAVRL